VDQHEGNGGEEKKDGLSEYEEWKSRDEAGEEEDPRELFRQLTHISLCISFDLVDKLRWIEKEMQRLPQEAIEERLPHMATLLDRFKEVYLEFADIDF
jgi:hypothetical protein